MTRKQITERYDSNLGFPTADMVTKMKDACDVIKNKMNTYEEWFKVLKLKPWSEDELFEKLVDTVKFSILHDGYHWSIPNSAAGWKSVMFKYKDMCNEFKDEAKKAKGKGDARAKGDAKVKDDVKVSGGKGKGKVMEDEEEDDEKPAPSAKTSGRGRGRGASRGGRGRGGKKAKDDSEEEESEDDMEVEEDAPKGRGRGRGRGRGTKRGVAASASRSPGPQRKKTRK